MEDKEYLAFFFYFLLKREREYEREDRRKERIRGEKERLIRLWIAELSCVFQIRMIAHDFYNEKEREREKIKIFTKFISQWILGAIYLGNSFPLNNCHSFHMKFNVFL